MGRPNWLITLCVLGRALGASADTFSGASHGHFSMPTPAGSVVLLTSTFGETNNLIGTGTPDPNILRLDSRTFSTVAADTPFGVSLLTYHNGANTLSATDFPVAIAVDFSAPSLSRSFDFSLHLDITENGPQPSAADDDILTLPTAFSATNFSSNGTTYTLKLLGFSTDGGQTIASQFRLPEGQTVQSTLFAEITVPGTGPTELTPLPGAATAGLMLLASMGLRRPRRTA